METPKVVALIGAILMLVSLLVGLSIVSAAIDAGLTIDPVIGVGFIIGLVCMIVLFFSQNAPSLLIAGAVGALSSFLIIGGIIGVMGGILGIVSGFLINGEKTAGTRKSRSRGLVDPTVKM